MHEAALATYLILALLVAMLSVAVRRLKIASPILMLVAGGALAFAPGAPDVPLDPDFVLMVLLPPLLYSSGVGMSWRGFKSNLRPILLLAIGCVLFTTLAVAVVVHYALGAPWAVGFLLGAIVSPPDAVSPMAVLRAMRLPQRLMTILEGESLVNDATALVAFSFALTAVTTGAFSLPEAASRFALIVGGELAFGIGVGWIMLQLRRLATDPRAEVLLALSSPFIAFWPPHQVGGSGVVACVAAGLYVSWNGRKLIRPETRLQGFFIWNLIVWGIEALVFLLTGLQARAVVLGLAQGDWTQLLIAGALVSATVVLVRFVWVYPATYIPRLIVPAIRRADPTPGWRMPFLISFAGLRGVVSLAAALSIPLTVEGQPFPYRDLVLIATFSVIAITLIGLGAALPPLVRALGLSSLGADEASAGKRAEQAVRLGGIEAALDELETHLIDGEPPAAIESVRRHLMDRHQQLTATADVSTADDPVADAIAIELRLLDAERQAIDTAFVENRLSDEARRRIERELDLEEARIRHALASTSTRGDSEPET